MSTRKNVYIRPEDQVYFEKAEAMFGDNFSAMVAEAVKKLVEIEEAKAEGMEEIELEVGVYHARGSDDIKKIKFIGKEIASAVIYSGQISSGDDRGTDFTLYLTRKGKFLLHRYFWTRWQGEESEAVYNVYDSFTQLASSDNVPGDLIREAGEALGMDIAEYLDV